MSVLVITGYYLYCDCSEHWIGPECNTAEICQPHPCTDWQTCIGLASYVSLDILNSELVATVKSGYHCVGKSYEITRYLKRSPSSNIRVNF